MNFNTNGALFAAATLFVSAVSAHSADATFNFTPKEFVEKFNKHQDGANGEKIGKCTDLKKDGENSMICMFDDKHFQNAVGKLKELNLANGKFKSKTGVIFSRQKGKVTRIVVMGDRSDPINQLSFGGAVGDVMIVLSDGKVSPGDDLSRKLIALGVARGDDDPSIGRPKVEIEDYAAITCNNQDSSITTGIGCALEPRY